MCLYTLIIIRTTKDLWNSKLRSTTLGLNMYAKNRSAIATGAAATAATGDKTSATTTMPHEDTGAPKSDIKSPRDGNASAKASGPTMAGTARAELNLLADLLGRVADDHAEAKPIKLTLLAEDPFCGFGSNTSNVVKTERVMFDASKSRNANAAEIMSKIGMDDVGSAGEGKGDDDLLDLMDQAAFK